MEFDLSGLPVWHPRLPTDEEISKLLLYLWKMENSTVDGLTEELREYALIDVSDARIAVFDGVRDDTIGWSHNFARIMVVIWSERYILNYPFYYDIFAWYQGKGGEEE